MKIVNLALLSAAAFSTAYAQPDIAFDSVPNLLKTPDHLYLGEAAGVATTSKGHIIVYTRTGDAYATIGTSRTFTSSFPAANAATISGATENISAVVDAPCPLPRTCRLRLRSSTEGSEISSPAIDPMSTQWSARDSASRRRQSARITAEVTSPQR